MRKPRLQRTRFLTGFNSSGTLTLLLTASVIVIAVLAVYYQDLTIVFNDAMQDEAANYVLVVPILFVYLLYRKRKMIRSAISSDATDSPKDRGSRDILCGILLLATAIMFYWYGSTTFTPLEYHVLTLPVFASGLTLVLFNFRTFRQAAFPIAFLVFLMPPPSEILYGLGSTLSVVSAEASSALVNLLGLHTAISSEYGNPTIILTRPDQTSVPFTVDIACSGIYSLIGFFVFAAFIAYITREKTWKKTTIFMLGLPFIYALNIARLSIILLIGYQYGEQLALQAFHLLGGWILIFLGTILLLTVTERFFKTRIFARPSQAPTCPNGDHGLADPADHFCTYCGRLVNYPRLRLGRTDIARVIGILLLVALLISIQTPVFALTVAPTQLMIQTPNGDQGNTRILPQIPARTLQFVYEDKNFEQEAKQDASLIYKYTSPNGTDQPVYVGIEVAQTTSSLHRWESCLITWPQTRGYRPKVTQLALEDIQILQNPPIIARYFAFQYTSYNQTQAVLYWFETSLFSYNGTTQQKHVEISLIVYADSPQNVTEMRNKLMPFATAIAAYWQPIKTWSQIDLFLSNNSTRLVLLPITMLIALMVFQALEDRRRKLQNLTTYQKLSQSDKQLLEAFRQTEPTASTTQNITAVYRRIGNNNTSGEETYERILRLEESKVINRQIISRQDDPTLIWKTNFRKPGKAKEKPFTLLRKSLLPSFHKTKQNS